MLDHDRHLPGGHVLGGENEVAFVFAVGGVEDDDEFAAFLRGKREGESAGGVFSWVCEVG